MIQAFNRQLSANATAKYTYQTALHETSTCQKHKTPFREQTRGVTFMQFDIRIYKY